MEMTGSTDVYGGPSETLEMASLLAKKEPEVDDRGLSCDTPDGRTSRRLSPRRDLFPAIQTAHVANPTKITAYWLPSSYNNRRTILQQECPCLLEH